MFEGMNTVDSVLFVSILVGFATVTSWAAWMIAAATAWLMNNQSRVWAFLGFGGAFGVVSIVEGYTSHLALMTAALIPMALAFAMQVAVMSFLVSKLAISKGEAE